MAMTVKELREELAKYPDNAEVFTEGCDCTGDAGHVTFNAFTNNVMINRGSLQEWEEENKRYAEDMKRMEERDRELRKEGCV